jgi:2-polyprenyl-3-methyl-5-hydroxy-6-metoxy-1,4-benzoquinol methylase
MPSGCCRFCGSKLSVTFADLGMSPPSNSYLTADQLHAMEPFYPLHAWVCEKCRLVQLEEFETPRQIFSDYAYFSSYSESWLRHAQAYVEMMCRRFGFGPKSRVIEIASNDGYLLQYFKKQDIDVLGIEPAENVAKVAIEQRGIPTRVEFFGKSAAANLVKEKFRPDLLLGNNVLAHVPDINDFVAGMKILLSPAGIITMEFPHLLRLIAQNQFDTIYHEHFSYLSFDFVRRLFAAHGLAIFDVEGLSTHGGSIRIFASHAESPEKIESRVETMLQAEREAGLDDMSTYRAFDERIKKTKRAFLRFLVEAKSAGKSIAAYGAAAKGNTLLNYCGVRADFIDYVVDRSPHKQGRFLPGTHLPIHSPEMVAQTKPDYLLILPWNLREEIMEQMRHIRQWGGKFVVAIPTTEVI